jgi:hypothetical protein
MTHLEILFEKWKRLGEERQAVLLCGLEAVVKVIVDEDTECISRCRNVVMKLALSIRDEHFSNRERLQVVVIILSRFWQGRSGDHWNGWVAFVNEVVQKEFETIVKTRTPSFYKEPIAGYCIWAMEELFNVGEIDMAWLIKIVTSHSLREVAVKAGSVRRVRTKFFELMPKVARRICEENGPDVTYIEVLSECWQAMRGFDCEIHSENHDAEWKRRQGVRAMTEIMDIGNGLAKDRVLSWVRTGGAEDLDGVLHLGVLECCSKYYAKEDLWFVWGVMIAKLEDPRRAVIKAVAHCFQAFIKSSALMSCLEDPGVMESLAGFGDVMEGLLNVYREDRTVKLSKSLVGAMEGAMESLLELMIGFHSQQP